MKQNILTDISALTKTSSKGVDSLVSLVCQSIANEIFLAKNDGESELILDIGIGLLAIDLTTMQVKFTPSKELKTDIKSALNGTDILTESYSTALIAKLLDTCQEVI